MAEQIALAIMGLLAGIGVFLLAVRLLSRNIEAMSGQGLKSLFSKTSKSKVLGAGLGAFTAAVIQSSGAVTVMVIGFINAGLMDLVQGSSIAFGANIGTTITGQIVALGMFGTSKITSTVVFMALTGVGAFIMLFAKKDVLQKIGAIVAGFGLLFVGLHSMSNAMSDFAQMESLRAAIAAITNPILLVLIGTLITAILQSSSVVTSILITMVFSGLISLDQGIYIVMGSNIGAGIVAILAALGGTADAKRVAVIHLLFNVFGAVVFLIAGAIMGAAKEGLSFGYLFEKMFVGAPQTQLAMFHTVYNVIKVALFLPLTKPVCILFTKIIKDKKPVEEGPRLAYVEEHFLKTPPIAVEMVKKEVVRMSELAIANFNRAIKIVTDLDFAGEEKFKEVENELNFLNRQITKFVTKIPRDQISDNDNIYLSTVYHNTSDFERVGDYAENIVEYASSLKKENKTFSSDAIEEVLQLQELINDLYARVRELYIEGKNVLPDAFLIEDHIDDYTQKISDNHVQRMNEGVCSPDVGSLYLELASNAERIGDHLTNVAKSTRKYNKWPV